MKKHLHLIFILILTILLCACSSGNSSLRFGEEVFRNHDYEMPVILGQPEFNDEQIQSSDGLNDIRTLADLMAYYDLTDFEFRNSEAIAKHVCYALKGDYEELGTIICSYDDKEYYLNYFKVDGKYLPIDVYAEYKSNRKWMEGYQGKEALFDTCEEMTNAIQEYYAFNDKKFDDVTYEIGSMLVNGFLVDASNIRCKKGLENQALQGYIKHYVPEYSDEEIQKMVEEDLTLEEAAERLRSMTDAVNYIIARGMATNDWLPNINQRYNGIEWVWGNSAEFTFNEKIYACSGITNLFNRLMAGDFDSEGYVITNGHTYNYFEDDGLYYYCDFSGIEDPKTATFDPYYPRFITDDIQDAVSTAKRTSFNFKLLCQYEHTGDGVPMGFYASDPNRDQYRLVVSDEIEGKFIQLYSLEEREIVYDRAPQGSEKNDDYYWLKVMGFKW